MLLVPLYLETDPVISSEVLGLPTSVVLSPVAPDSGLVSVVNSLEMELPSSSVVWLDNSSIEDDKAAAVSVIVIFSSSDMLLVALYSETDPVISSEVLELPTSIVLSPVAPDSGLVPVVNSLEIELPSSSVVWLDNSSTEDDKAAAVSVIVIFSSSDMLLVPLYSETDPEISSEVISLPPSTVL